MTQLKLLCLTGGGFRGYYTISVLASIEENFKANLSDYVHVYAGTSIGGIVALGLACGLKASDIKKSFIEEKDNIFKKPFLPNVIWQLWGQVYDSNKLEQAIINIIGEENAQKKLRDIAPVIVTTVELTTRKPILVTNLCDKTDDWTVLDAALATSAAPTYFSGHKVKKSVYVDGGLACNLPDSIAVEACFKHTEITSRDSIHMLSIGTGKIDEVAVMENQGIFKRCFRRLKISTLNKSSGGLKWLSYIASFSIDAQANMIDEQMKSLLMKSRYCRIDSMLKVDIKLDDTSEAAIKELSEQSKIAVDNAMYEGALIDFMNLPTSSDDLIS